VRPKSHAEPEEGPSAPPGRGGPHACSGASCCLGEPFWAHQNAKKSVGRRGSAPDPAGGAYSAPPGPLAGGEGLRGALLPPSPRTPFNNIVIVLVLCVCTHVYEKALLLSLEC